ncbi:MAG TPA: hypothetical protein PKL97_02875 [Candidatus Omnitrophota bacterium]|nr:hypothetical protein [Candidatus Omnitrophota bacterium]
MKKIAALGLVMLMAGTALAATPKAQKVNCDVKGVIKKVKSIDACKALGGTVVPPKAVKK